MPDYFVDRLVHLEGLKSFFSKVERKASISKGGSVRGVIQSEGIGGNGVNLARALGRFGANVELFAIADSLPLSMLTSSLEAQKNVSLHPVSGASGLTTALEFSEGQKRLNVMLSDVGSLASFDGSVLSKKTWKKIDSCKISCVVNWAANERGTELCERVFTRSKKNGARTFLDPADLSGMERRVRKLKKIIFVEGLLDIFSVNENEARIVGKLLSGFSLPFNFSSSELMRAGSLISEVTNSEVDIHTSSMSVSSNGRDSIVVPCEHLKQRIATGAGDVWDAADIAGYLLGWKAEDRLRFANSAAGVYVSGGKVDSPSLIEVLSFMRRANTKR